MADEPATQESPPAPAPTPQAVEAATETAQEGGSKPQAVQAAAAEEKEQRPELSDKDVKRIASGLVDELDERGMFDHETPDANPPTVAAAVASTDAASAAAQSSEPSNAGPDEAPKKQSWASKFLRDKGED